MQQESSLNRVDSDDKIHIINPYNSRNRLIEAQDINRILKLVGIDDEVDDVDIWQTALTHKSYVKKENQDSKVILEV